MAQYDPVLLSVDKHVALITVNDPDRRNAVTDEMSAQLRAAIQRAEGDPDVHAVVVTGGGQGLLRRGRPECAGRRGRRSSRAEIVTALRRFHGRQ